MKKIILKLINWYLKSNGFDFKISKFIQLANGKCDLIVIDNSAIITKDNLKETIELKLAMSKKVSMATILYEDKYEETVEFIYNELINQLSEFNDFEIKCGLNNDLKPILIIETHVK